MSRFVPIEGSALVGDGSKKYQFNVRRVVLISNDSADYAMKVNFDKTVGEAGTFTLNAGEFISGEDIDITAVYFAGVNGTVTFRAWGVG